MGRIQPSFQCHNRIAHFDRMYTRRGSVYIRCAFTRMIIDNDSFIAVRTIRESAKDKLSRARNFVKVLALARRSYEYQVVAARVIHREKATPLHAEAISELREQLIQLEDAHHLSDARVMLYKLVWIIPRRIESAHTSVGVLDKAGVPEHHKRLL
jgi:hypothetical protein